MDIVLQKRQHIAFIRLQFVDFIQYFLKRRPIQLDLQLAVDLLENLLLIALVQYAERLRIEEVVDILTEHTHTKPMIRRDQAIVAALADKGTDTPFHLPGSFGGKGHAQNVSRMDTRGVHKIGVTMRKRLCLSGAGSCNDADIALCRRGRFDLLRIQIFEYILHNARSPSHDIPHCLTPVVAPFTSAYMYIHSPATFSSARWFSGSQ